MFIWVCLDCGILICSEFGSQQLVQDYDQVCFQSEHLGFQCIQEGLGGYVSEDFYQLYRGRYQVGLEMFIHDHIVLYGYPCIDRLLGAGNEYVRRPVFR